MSRATSILVNGAALLALAATRLPRPGWTLFAVAAALLVCIVLLIVMMRASPPRWAKGGLTISLLGLFLVPPAQASLLPGLPAIVAALLALWALDVLHAAATTTAPTLDGTLGQRAPWMRRAATIALIGLALLVLAAVSGLLPARQADAQEMRGASLPLLLGLVAVVPLLVYVWLRDAVREQAPAPPEAHS